VGAKDSSPFCAKKELTRASDLVRTRTAYQCIDDWLGDIPESGKVRAKDAGEVVCTRDQSELYLLGDALPFLSHALFMPTFGNRFREYVTHP